MSFLIYQRSDPRYPDWIPLTSQQVRLRNLIQVIGLNLKTVENDCVYYTLHLTPMSAPFFTSEKIASSSLVSWKEIEPRQIPNYVPLSAPGFVIRIWSTRGRSEALVSWGVIFKGLHYLGPKGGDGHGGGSEWKSSDFSSNTLIFRMPFGFFTALDSCFHVHTKPERFVSYYYPKLSELARHSYNVKSLTALHRLQRSVLEEIELARRLRYHISLYGYSASVETDGASPTISPGQSSLGLSWSASLPSLPKSISQFSINPTNVQLSNRALQRVQQGRKKLLLKLQIEALTLRNKMLCDEKGRSEGRVHRLKLKTPSLVDPFADLMARIHALGRERDRLREFKAIEHNKKTSLADKRVQLNLRKKQLISELLLIYPLQLVEGSKRYSISEIQLPNAEDYGNESASSIAVALGYTAHLVAMLSFFLGIPLRYPIRHFGSRSRIVDHITTQIPNKEREFPLYFRGKEDVYSKYAVYLLNKNIAQLRWYCGLSTPDLRATLPNLYNVLTSRLTIPGWPPSPSDSCEMAEELTEETHHQLFRNDLSLSLDGGLDQISNISYSSHISPTTVDNMRMQSWLSASVSDLEQAGVAGGNSVPIGEIQHGRAQNRFLSGWKKKTYSESEEIDPRWLTNSLNLELEFGTRPSITPSPPLRLPILSAFASGDKKDGHGHGGSKSRKRRVGRVEQSHSVIDTRDRQTLTLASPPGAGSPTTGSLVLPHLGLDSSQVLTPNHCISEVEHQIKEYERRKSICESGWGTGGGSPTQGPNATVMLPILPSTKEQSFSVLELPLVDNYPTTDEEKMDDTIADVVRKISLMEMQLNRAPPLKSPTHQSNPPDSPTLSSSSTLLQMDPSTGNTSTTLVTPELEAEEGEETFVSHQMSPHHRNIVDRSEGESGDVDRIFNGSISQNSWNNNGNDKDGYKVDRPGLERIGEVVEHEQENEVDEESELKCETEERNSWQTETSMSTPVPVISSNCDDIVKVNNGDIPSKEISSEKVPDCDIDGVEVGGVERVDRILKSVSGMCEENEVKNVRTNGDEVGEGEEVDPSSLWFRTEALLNSQSFNLVKRRISESN